MNKIVKWIAILVGGLFILLVLAIVLIPLFVDINHYKPQLEQQVTNATGRTFTLGGDLKLSLFPWVGISLTDLHFGNPEGFTEKDLIAVDEFRVKVKVIPLLSKEIQVNEFVLSGARVVLETQKDGRTGWQGLSAGDAVPKQPDTSPEEVSKDGGLPISGLEVAEFSINDCSILWADYQNNIRKEIKDLKLLLTDLSFDKPIQAELAAIVDNYPLSLTGQIGPLGQKPGEGTVPINLSIAALDLVNTTVSGTIEQPLISPQFNLTLELKEFSPRQVMDVLKQPLPITPTDEQVLTKFGLGLRATGTPEEISISDGKLSLDDSNIAFSAAAKEFSKPNIRFDLKMDQIDLDRYLPPPADSEAGEETEQPPQDSPPPTQIDYTPLRKLVLNGQAEINRIKVKNVKVTKMLLKVNARNGLLKLDPFSMDLYDGRTQIVANVNVQKQRPKTDLKLVMNETQAGALISDFLEKDLIEGTLKSNVSLTMSGDTPDQIKKTLSGKGNLDFRNGAIKGVDLTAMVHNTAAAFGLTEKGKTAPKTEFTELSVPFSIKKGLINAPNTRLRSPVLQLQAGGRANLVNNKLNFRVEPKFVSPLSGQTKSKKRDGILVPVLISGTFDKVKFRPDLKAALEQNLDINVDKETEKLKQDLKKEIQKEIEKQLPGKKGDQQIDKATEKLKEEAQKLFKGLPFSN